MLGQEIRILPLGDSITFGCGSDGLPGGSADCASDAGGYRVPLLQALSSTYWKDDNAREAQLNVSTVGSLRTGPSYVPSWWLNHEGHPGWRIDQIDDPAERGRWVKTNPDIITVHLGTNDCGQNYQPATLNTKMRLLLNHTFAALPKVHVYLASILLMPTNRPTCASDFNKMVPDIVKDFAKAGHKIVYVPMAEDTGMCAGAGTPNEGLCAGGHVHPISAGYLRMASSFAYQILQTYDPNNPP